MGLEPLCQSHRIDGREPFMDVVEQLELGPDLLAAGGVEAGDGVGMHHPATAKRVIYLFMSGGPSQMETFDPEVGAGYATDLEAAAQASAASGSGKASMKPSPWLGLSECRIRSEARLSKHLFCPKKG